MAKPFAKLSAVDTDSGRVHIVVDTPRGSRNKYKLSDEGYWQLSKVLPQGMSFPYDFGFVPQTLAEDGDPVDVLVIMDDAAFCGCVVTVKLIGVIEAEQTEDDKTIRNDRLIGVVETPYNPAEYASLKELNEQRIDELERFFIAYNEAEGRKFKPLARRGPERAYELLNDARTGRRKTRAKG